MQSGPVDLRDVAMDDSDLPMTDQLAVAGSDVRQSPEAANSGHANSGDGGIGLSTRSAPEIDPASFNPGLEAQADPGFWQDDGSRRGAAIDGAAALNGSDEQIQTAEQHMRQDTPPPLADDTSAMSSLPSSTNSTRENSLAPGTHVLQAYGKSSLPQFQLAPESRLPYNVAGMGSALAWPSPGQFAKDQFCSTDYPYSNTSLIDYAGPTPSTSTAIFHFTVFPPKPLDESFSRTRIRGDVGYEAVNDDNFGYLATPEEVEETRARQAQKALERERAIAQASAKAKSKSKAKAPYTGKKRGRPKGSGSAAPKAAVVADSTAAGAVGTSEKSENKTPEDEAASRQTSPLAAAEGPIDVGGSEADDDAASNGMDNDVDDSASMTAPLMSASSSLAGPSGLRIESAAPSVASASEAVEKDASIAELDFPLYAPSNGTRRSKRDSTVRKSMDLELQALKDHVKHAKAASASRQSASTSRQTSQPPAQATQAQASAGSSATKPRRKQQEVEQLVPYETRVVLNELVPPDSPLGSTPGAAAFLLQAQECTAPLYAMQTECYRCEKHQPSDECVFIGLRTFAIDDKGEIIDSGIVTTDDRDSVVEYSKHDRAEEQLRYRIQYRAETHDDGDPTASLPADAAILRASVARQAAARLEQHHIPAALTGAKVAFDISKEWTCDTCLRSIWATKHVCEQCGRTACAPCLARLRQIHEEEDNAKSIEELAHIRGTASHDRQRRRRCHGRKKLYYDGLDVHDVSDFTTVTMWKAGELQQMLNIAKWSLRKHPEYATRPIITGRREDLTFADWKPYELNAVGMKGADAERLLLAQIAQERPTLIRTGQFELPEELRPEGFARTFRDYPVEVIYMDDGVVETQPADEFFNSFGESRDDAYTRKLKALPGKFSGEPDPKPLDKEDWDVWAGPFSSYPTLIDKFFEELLNDFGALVLSDRAMKNVLSHAPRDCVQPIIGMPSVEPTGFSYYFPRTNFCQKGPSANLQMAHGDLVNTMWYAAKKRPSHPAARWHVYPPSAIEELRPFVIAQLARKLKVNLTKYADMHDDPLFLANMYWDKANQNLFESMSGFKMFEIKQNPGETVVIPAGSAYQCYYEVDSMSVEHYVVTLPSIDRALEVHEHARNQNRDRSLWCKDLLKVEASLFWSLLEANEFDTPPDDLGGSDVAGSEIETSPAPLSIPSSGVPRVVTTLPRKRKRVSAAKEDLAYKGKQR